MYSKITLVGTATAAPDLRYTNRGEAVCDFPLAVNRVWQDTNGRQEKTTWYRITCWGGLAESCNERITKSSQVFVEGRLEPGDDGNPEIWIDKSGKPRATYEVTGLTAWVFS